MPNAGGQLVINTPLATWTFESDDYVESVAKQDVDYMYFGYWLQSPDPDPADDDDVTDYNFVTLYGGAIDGTDNNVFSIATASGLIQRGREDDALTATYVGGAAGRYVTRKLRLVDQEVDPRSPGYTGRFTATAKLTANFGTHSDFDGKDMTEEPTTILIIQSEEPLQTSWMAPVRILALR